LVCVLRAGGTRKRLASHPEELKGMRTSLNSRAAVGVVLFVAVGLLVAGCGGSTTTCSAANVRCRDRLLKMPGDPKIEVSVLLRRAYRAPQVPM
jgi:hypothetical protein